MKYKPRENYTIVPMNLNVDAKLPKGFEGIYSSACVSLPCRGCQACQCQCVQCRRMDPSLEERSANLDSKKLFAELLAA